MRGRARVDLARFGEILNAYGAHPRRWPLAERAAALALAASSPHAAAMRAEAARLDRLLDRVTVPAVSPALIGAILSDVSTARRFSLQHWVRTRGLAPVRDIGLLGTVWRSAIALALATLLGVGVGAGMGGLMPFTSSVLTDLSVGAYGELVE